MTIIKEFDRDQHWVSIRHDFDDSAQETYTTINELVAIARADFPELRDSNIHIQSFGHSIASMSNGLSSERRPGPFGINFKTYDTVPASYKRIEEIPTPGLSARPFRRLPGPAF